MILIGTAGHVDHGKSTLVEALTGINPMHLPEEHRRQLTIELGFAHLSHPAGHTLGIVDVPGHEKLVKTMISGASAFQLALWVVDAREGLMPQSLEHLNILRLLGVSQIIPVITKADLATSEQIGDTLGSITRLLPEAKALVVDSVTKRGISELLQVIFDACTALGQDRRHLEAPVYLPVDRCFVLTGVGTVLTGTLVRGRLSEGDSVSVSSSPEVYRIRSLHRSNTRVETISAGHRVGVHLHGIRADQVQRGDCLVSPGYPYRSRMINVQLELLSDAGFRWKPGIRAHFLAAAFDVECRVWDMVQFEGGFWAQIHLPIEACFFSGQRFVLRSTNPLKTIGGGTILDIAPDRMRRVTEAERSPARYFDLCKVTVFDLGCLERKWMCERSELIGPNLRTAGNLIWPPRLEALALDRVREWVAQSKGQEKEWSFQTLASALSIKTEHVGQLLGALLPRLADLHGVLTVTSSTLRYDPNRGGPSQEERRVADALLRELKSAGLQPPRVADYPASVGDRKTIDKAVARLVREGRLVRIDMELVVEREAWNSLTDRIRACGVEQFSVSEFGKRFGLSRKYSVPFLESLNRSGFMRREGDRHVVNRRRP